MICGEISKTSEVHTVCVITSGSVEKTYVLYTAGIVYIHDKIGCGILRKLCRKPHREGSMRTNQLHIYTATIKHALQSQQNLEHRIALIKQG